MFTPRLPAPRTAVAVAVVTGAAVLAVGLVASRAAAHRPSLSAACSGLSFAGRDYEGPAANNELTVTIDGQATRFDFGASFARTLAWDPLVAHIWSATLDANRSTGDPDRYDRAWSGVQAPCPPTTTTASPTSSDRPRDTTTSSAAPSSTPGTTAAVASTTSAVTDIDSPPPPVTETPAVAVAAPHPATPATAAPRTLPATL
jgi:hypothetical protein